MENTNKSPLMYGIVDSDGVAYLGENCVASSPQQLFAELNGLNDSPDAGYKIVALGQVYLDAAAPQVVADERAAFEADTLETYAAATFGRFPASGRYNADWIENQWAGWQRRAALAAMAQSQEPVAETYAHTMSNGRGRPDDPAPFETVCVRLLRNDLPADLKLYAAPVQPVAVPDGALPALPERDGVININVYTDDDAWNADSVRAYGQVCHALGRGAAVREYVENGTFAAPAAQGDAKEPTDKQLIAAFSNIFYADHQGNPDGYELAIGRAAIAAKAAS